MGRAEWGPADGRGAGAWRARLLKASRRLLADQGGGLLVFGLFILVVMLAAAGLAVDTMRHERERARLQSTLDRAVLAAADLDHVLDPEAVVRSYFETAGLSASLGEITVERGLNHRSISAQASHAMPTALLGLSGVKALRVGAGARAEERVTDIEISLVLDVSGSMRHHERMTNLKVAAAEFVDSVMPKPSEPRGEGVTTLSIAPYAATVNVGAELLGLYGVQAEHAYSYCIDFADAAFSRTAPTPGAPGMRQFDHYTRHDPLYLPGSPRRITEAQCPRAADPGQPETSLLLPLAARADPLRKAIAGLRPEGWTATDVGMLWGLAMLDPQTRPVVDALITSGRVDPVAAGRPHDYGSEDVLKVLVLMTDGEPTEEYPIRREIRSGPSNVWYDQETGAYSVLVRGTHLRNYPYGTTAPVDFDALGPPDGIVRVAPKRDDVDDRSAPRWYWVREDGSRIRDSGLTSNKGPFHDYPASGYSGSTENRNNWTLLGANLRRLDYREVHERFTGYDARQFLFRHPHAERFLSDAERSLFTTVDNSAATAERVTDRALALCRAAKDRGVIVFTIGFELERISEEPNRARARGLMRDCATSPAHYFDVKSVAISEAFATIATQIEQLRLTR